MSAWIEKKTTREGISAKAQPLTARQPAGAEVEISLLASEGLTQKSHDHQKAHEAPIVAGLLLLTAATACGARTELPSDGDGAAGGASSSCTLEIDKGTTVTALIAEGERIYYVANHGRVMAVDADTGEGKVLAQIPIQALNTTIVLALEAESVYVTFFPQALALRRSGRFRKQAESPS